MKMKTFFPDREEITFVWLQEMWSFLGGQSFLWAKDRQRRCAKHRQVKIRKAVPKGLQNGTKKEKKDKPKKVMKQQKLWEIKMRIIFIGI